MIEQSFAVESPSLDIRIASGKVQIVEGAEGRVVVRATGDTDSLRVEQRGSAIWAATERNWNSRAVYLTVEAPHDIDVDVSVASADVECGVTARRLSANSASGDIRFKDTAELAVKTASGDVHGHSIGGRLSFASASGDLHIETVSDRAEISTASGDIFVSHAGGSMTASTMSGDIRIGHFAGAELRCKSMSGNVDVGVPAGTEVDLDATTLSGDIRLPEPTSETPAPQGSLDLDVRLVSGDLRLRRV